jgi:hypothetical protein
MVDLYQLVSLDTVGQPELLRFGIGQFHVYNDSTLKSPITAGSLHRLCRIPRALQLAHVIICPM